MRFRSFGTHARLAVALITLVLGCLDAPTAPMPVPAGSTKPHAKRVDRARIEFAALAPGDEVTVQLKSDGCFHHFAAEVLLTREASGFAVELRGADANLISGARLTAVASLDAEEMDKLDRVLGFYRTDRPGGCTTVDHVTLRVLSGALQGVEESFTDASCGTLEQSLSVPFDALLRVVHDTAKKGAA